MICNCVHNKIVKSYLPDVIYNSKKFTYLQCNSCKLIFISPFPDTKDFDKMYPPEYQCGLDLTIQKDLKIKLPGLRYDYAFQFDLIKRFASGKNIVDYGCGNANFIVNAVNAGYKCDGVEYNLDFIKILKQNLNNVPLYTLDEFYIDDKKYDVIRLSNVLEHLNHPKFVVDKLCDKLVNNGILIIEGPLEDNFSIAYFFRKTYFIVRKLIQKKWKVYHSPTHIFFSNRNNQQQMLKNDKLEQVYFSVKEDAWPFPEKISFSNGIGNLIKGLIAKISIFLSNLNSNWGNTFIYVGKKKE